MPTVRRGSTIAYPPTWKSNNKRVATPEHIWVTCFEMPEAAGRYQLMRERRNDMPVWKGGNRYLYCNSGGGWMLASDYEHMETNRGWLASANPHDGLLPDEHVEWESADGSGGWLKMTDIQVLSRAPRFPVALTVQAPTRPEVSGKYTLQPDKYHNGFPIWECNDRCLYSGEGGWWLVDPDKQRMELDRGLLASRIKHGGRLPDKIPGWEVADGGGGWELDSTVTVSSSVTSNYSSNSSSCSSKKSSTLQRTPVAAPATSTATPVALPKREAQKDTQKEQVRLAGLELEISELTQRNVTLSEELVNQKQQSADIKLKKDVLQSDFDASELQHGRSKRELLDLKAIHETLCSDHESVLQELEMLREGNSAQQVDHTNVLESLQVSNNKIISLQSEVELLAEGLLKSQTEAEQSKSHMEQQKEIILTLETTLTSTKEMIKEQESEKTVLKAAAEVMQIEIENLSSENKSLSASNQNVEQELCSTEERLNSEIRTAESAMAELRFELRETQTTAGELRGSCASQTTNIKSLSETNHRLTSQVNEYYDRITSLESQLESERECRKRHLENAKKAAEVTVKAAADSLLLLINNDSASASNLKMAR